MKKFIALLILMIGCESEIQRIEVRGTREQINDAKTYLEKDPNVKKIETDERYIHIWTNDQQPLPNLVIDEALLKSGARLLD